MGVNSLPTRVMVPYQELNPRSLYRKFVKVGQLNRNVAVLVIMLMMLVMKKKKKMVTTLLLMMMINMINIVIII